MSVKLDPVREARARRMVLNPTTWATDVLPMKRMVHPMEFGVIYLQNVSPNRIIISASPGENRAAIIFGSIDELVAAGWTVD